MIRQIRNIFVYVLAIALISMSMVQAVVAAHVDSIEPKTHAAHDGAHHHHDQALIDQKSKRGCLDFCSETISNGYLFNTALEVPSPHYVVSYPFSSVLTATTVSQSCFVALESMARGPPEFCKHPTVAGLRGLLMRNARIRN